jgi:hypothetical protein
MGGVGVAEMNKRSTAFLLVVFIVPEEVNLGSSPPATTGMWR